MITVELEILKNDDKNTYDLYVNGKLFLSFSNLDELNGFWRFISLIVPGLAAEPPVIDSENLGLGK